MADFTYPFNLTNGDTADADQVMGNFNAVKAAAVEQDDPAIKGAWRTVQSLAMSSTSWGAGFRTIGNGGDVADYSLSGVFDFDPSWYAVSPFPLEYRLTVLTITGANTANVSLQLRKVTGYNAGSYTGTTIYDAGVANNAANTSSRYLFPAATALTAGQYAVTGYLNGGGPVISMRVQLQVRNG